MKTWIDKIKQVEKGRDRYFARCREIEKRYKDERDVTFKPFRRYNILWSNTQTVLPMLYGGLPSIHLDRRFKDDDPLARVGCELLERVGSYLMERYDYDSALRQTVLDYTLFGQGTAWVVYKKKVDEQTGVAYEKVCLEWVPYKNFGCEDCTSWADVTWVYRTHLMSDKYIKERFGNEAEISDFEKKDYDNKDKSEHCIYEIWDKSTKKVYWIAEYRADEPLAVDDDPLNIYGFFPCPRPLLGTTANDSLIPTPDYWEWRDQALELDELSHRIKQVTKTIQAKGLYDSSEIDLSVLFETATENTLTPVKNWSNLVEKGGLERVMAWVPFDKNAEVLRVLLTARQQVLQEIYEISGMSDIMRGASNPRETAQAQSLKAKFGSIRLQEKQKDIARFIRDIVRIVVEIVAEKFDPQTIAAISNMNLPLMSGPEGPGLLDTIKLLRQDGLRSFKIDVETSETVTDALHANPQERIQYIQGVNSLLEQAAKAAQSVPGSAPLYAELIMFAIRSMKAGRTLEGKVEQALQGLVQQASQPQPPPQPTPDAQLKAQTDLQKKQMETQSSQNIALIQAETKLWDTANEQLIQGGY